MSRHIRKTTKNRPAALDLQKDQAAIVFGPAGVQLFLPEVAAPHVQFAIALWCRIKDSTWVYEQQRWAAEMQREGEADHGAVSIMEGESHAVH